MLRSCQILLVKSVRFTMNMERACKLSQFMHNFSPGLVKIEKCAEKSEIWGVWSESVRFYPKA